MNVKTLFLVFASASVLVLAAASEAKSLTLTFEQVIGDPLGDPSQPENLLLPQGIAIEDETDNIYVGDSEKARVAVFSAEGEYLFDFGQGQITGETANLDFNREGQLFVGDVDGNEIDVFEPDGTYVRSFGEFTIGTDRPFEGPAGLGFSPDFEQFYVANYAGDEIIVFNSETGNVINTIGTGGQEPGQLFGPAAVAVSPTTGNLYVSEQLNSRIQVLTPEGESLRTFGIPRPRAVVDPFAPVPENIQPGELSSPVDIALDEFENVYVADTLNNRIQVFSSQGEFLTLVDEFPAVPSTYIWTVGAEYDKGKLYTSDFINNRVVVFDVEDNAPLEASTTVPEPSSIFSLVWLGLSAAGVTWRQRWQ